jgi:hypothetical protein
LAVASVDIVVLRKSAILDYQSLIHIDDLAMKNPVIAGLTRNPAGGRTGAMTAKVPGFKRKSLPL